MKLIVWLFFSHLQEKQSTEVGSSISQLSKKTAAGKRQNLRVSPTVAEIYRQSPKPLNIPSVLLGARAHSAV